jgi:hypothetical protein
MQQQRTEAAALEAEIARLRSLALDALRRRWRVVFGRTPPAPLSKDLLGRMISYMPLWAKMLPHGHRQGAGRWPSCSATIERAPALGKVAIRVRLENSSVFGFNRVTLEDGRVFGLNHVTLEDGRVFGLNRVTGRGRKACRLSIPVKLAARLHPLARIPANSRVPADLGAIVPFSPIAAHRLHFATQSGPCCASPSDA